MSKQGGFENRSAGRLARCVCGRSNLKMIAALCFIRVSIAPSSVTHIELKIHF
jgi:hypothetical protein